MNRSQAVQQNRGGYNSNYKPFVCIKILRVLACIGVFAVHFGQRTNLSGWIRTLTDFGAYGVHLFFILSGFLAAFSLTNNYNDSVLKYYKKRAIRIFPTYYFVILWYAISENLLNLSQHHIPPDTLGLGWLRYIFLLNGVVNSDTYFWSNIGITWTIPVFVFFYLLAPWIMKVIKNLKQATILTIFVFAVRLILSRFYECRIVSYLYIFFLGIIAFFAYKEKSNLFLIICTIISMGMFVLGFWEYGYCLLFVILLLLLIQCDEMIKLTNRQNKILSFIDARSYTFYLIHGVVFCSFIDRLKYSGLCSSFVLGCGAICLSIVGTLIVYRFFENPVQKWLSKRLLKS